MPGDPRAGDSETTRLASGMVACLLAEPRAARAPGCNPGCPAVHPAGSKSGQIQTGGVDGERRSCAMAVRVCDDQSLLFRAGHHRPGLPDRVAADSLVSQQARRVPAADPVLRHPAGHQRGDRRGHRPGPGIPVRDELVGLLAAGRQHLRCAAGHGGAGRVLPGIHVPGALAVRLGQAVPAGASPDDLAGLAGYRPVGGVHHGGQLVDAASGRLRDGQAASRS